MSGVETNGSVEIKMPKRTKVRDEPDEGRRRGTVENTCGGILIWWCRGEKSMGIDMEESELGDENGRRRSDCLDRWEI